MTQEQEQKLERLTYNTKEVAQLLGISTDKVERMVKELKIRPLVISKRPFIFPKSEIERALKDLIPSKYWKEE